MPIRFLVCMAVVVATASACGRRGRRTPDDTLVVLIPNVIRDIDPRFAQTNYDTKLSRLVIPGLTTTDRESMEPMLELAESITRLDDVTWDVFLRPGIRFSNGEPVTGEDVRYTYESTLAESVKALHRKQFRERFKSIEVLSPRRVRFHLVAPVATLLGDMDFGILWAGGVDHDDRFPGGVAIGAGAYRLIEIGAERVLLERNPFYYEAKPPTDKILVRTVRDKNAQALMVVGGSADIIQNSVRPDLVDSIIARPRVEVTTGPSAILSYLMMNNDHRILSDVRVRQAIAYAIDRETIVRAKFGGRAVLATGLLPPSHWAYYGRVPRYDHDPARARALLDEAGYPDPDGPGGEPRMRLTYKTSANQFRVAIARIIAAQLGEVGIDVTVRAFEFGTFFMDIKKGNFELGSMQTSAITDPDWAYAYFHSSRVPTRDNLHVHNRWRYRNDRLDELVTAGRREMDRTKRFAIYAEVQEILARDVPVIPLWHEDNVAVMNASVRNYHVLPNARFRGLETASK